MGLEYISKLAQPKVCHQVVFNRPSVYWTDKIPTTHHRFTTPVLTPRQEVLSRSKKVDPAFKEDRSSSERHVTKAALKAKASPRLRQLAEPRPCADGWEFSRPLYSVSKGAMAAIPSERIVLLAKPKELPATPSDQPRKPVHRGIVRNAKFDELSKPRIYTLDVHDPYKISKAALQYVPSPRILEISHSVRGRVA